MGLHMQYELLPGAARYRCKADHVYSAVVTEKTCASSVPRH